jgi:hypothetical protein
LLYSGLGSRVHKPLYLKCIFNTFENIKLFWRKYCVYILTSYMLMKLLQEEPTFYAACVKMAKFHWKWDFCGAFFFSHMPRKISIFHETLAGHIECADIHAHNFLLFIFILIKRSIYIQKQNFIYEDNPDAESNTHGR